MWVFYFGGAVATTFEQIIADLATWFIDNPSTGWARALAEAQSITQPESYRY